MSSDSHPVQHTHREREREEHTWMEVKECGSGDKAFVVNSKDASLPLSFRVLLPFLGAVCFCFCFLEVEVEVEVEAEVGCSILLLSAWVGWEGRRLLFIVCFLLCFGGSQQQQTECTHRWQRCHSTWWTIWSHSTLNWTKRQTTTAHCSTALRSRLAVTNTKHQASNSKGRMETRSISGVTRRSFTN